MAEGKGKGKGKGGGGEGRRRRRREERGERLHVGGRGDGGLQEGRVPRGARGRRLQEWVLRGAEQARVGALLHRVARLGHSEIALKIQKSAQHYTEAAMDEIKILKQIAEGDPADKKCVVKLLDHFKHSGPNGQHVCMVFEYLGDNLLTLIKYSDYRGVPLHMVKELCFHILVGLDYLHRQLSVIHTDLKPENILLLSMIDPSKDPTKSGAPLIPPTSEDEAARVSSISKETKSVNGNLTKNQKKKIRKKAKKAAQGRVAEELCEEGDSKAFEPASSNNDEKESEDSIDEQSHDSLNRDDSSKSDENKDAYEGNTHHRSRSRATRQKLLAEVDLKCKLVDFGNACWTHKQFTNDIQTRQYRCPEVILGSRYSTSADLWSFACICFELATGDVLFDPHSGKNYERDEVFTHQCSIEYCHFSCGISLSFN
ncbi:hypothetical protein EUGRSUZ_B03905 [Eucalyptus grandis]|uniref:non-specific serine/threonine protein kinase n=2 Tax=Eucalyptus grandis TaxID=71139 RepID=A0A059DB62_EUCGR|nr:hypothetical protein EUGRSUZ_B03905 [Eucalyptus grandis]